MNDNELLLLDDLSQIYKFWPKCISYINHECSKDSLHKNYINLNPKEYLYFNCLVKKDEIISFGAIEKSPEKWGDEIARVLTRFWIHPKYRSIGFTKWNDNKIRYSPIILKAQLNFLKSKKEIKSAMITREGSHKHSFSKIVELANTVAENHFEIIPGIFNIYKPIVKYPRDRFYQMIAINSLSECDKNEILKNAQNKGFLKEKAR